MSIATITGQWADRKAGLGGAPGTAAQPLDSLTAYIPVESITLYVSALSALSALGIKWLSGLAIYLVFALVVTPAFTVLVAWAKHRAAGTALGVPARPLIFAAIAFLAWAPAVPGLVQSDPGKVAAAFAALAVSQILGLIDKALG
jgi:hypothetical protein